MREYHVEISSSSLLDPLQFETRYLLPNVRDVPLHVEREYGLLNLLQVLDDARYLDLVERVRDS